MLAAGQVMDDGKGVLADGTRYIRESGEDFGANGFWKRWTRLAGVSAQGKVITLMDKTPAYYVLLAFLPRARQPYY